jgi:hypothetical protein
VFWNRGGLGEYDRGSVGLGELGLCGFEVKRAGGESSRYGDLERL